MLFLVLCFTVCSQIFWIHPACVRLGHHIPTVLSLFLFYGFIFFYNIIFPVKGKWFHCLRNNRISPGLFLPHQSIFIKLYSIMDMVVSDISFIHSKVVIEKNHWEHTDVPGTKKTNKKQSLISRSLQASKTDDKSMA